jgi:hypothetical protein
MLHALHEYTDEWDPFQGGIVYLLKNAACLAACLPGQVDFMRWLWSKGHGVSSAWRLLAMAPLLAAAIYFTDLAALKLLAGWTLATAALQAGSMQHSKDIGRRLI